MCTVITRRRYDDVVISSGGTEETFLYRKYLPYPQEIATILHFVSYLASDGKYGFMRIMRDIEQALIPN